MCNFTVAVLPASITDLAMLNVGSRYLHCLDEGGHTMLSFEGRHTDKLRMLGLIETAPVCLCVQALVSLALFGRQEEWQGG